jgi:hypothetical protein
MQNDGKDPVQVWSVQRTKRVSPRKGLVRRNPRAKAIGDKSDLSGMRTRTLRFHLKRTVQCLRPSDPVVQVLRGASEFTAGFFKPTSFQ